MGFGGTLVLEGLEAELAGQQCPVSGSFDDAAAATLQGERDFLQSRFVQIVGENDWQVEPLISPTQVKMLLTDSCRLLLSHDPSR